MGYERRYDGRSILIMKTACPFETWENTGLFEMIVGALTTCHTQYIGVHVFFLFNRTTLQVFVTYRTSALYVHPL